MKTKTRIMNKASSNNRSVQVDRQSGEAAENRVMRLYNAPGGPLLGWLTDEAHSRGFSQGELAAKLGVTYGYIAQLRSGHRQVHSISHGFATACARFLGVPTVVVLLLSGFLTMSDFAFTRESEEQVLERAIRQVQSDPHIRAALPFDLALLPADAQRAIALLYNESTGADLFRLRELPECARWLQRAAVVHDENLFAAEAGHRDTSMRCEHGVH
jgi:transcriptional regulator with XRE-family HTH domain